jgi:two-component system, cell cycle response regulator
MKILVAEDEVLSRRRLEKRLAEWGYEVVSVDNGEQAWAVLDGPDAPALAVLDWMMPGLDGPELCRLLRARGTNGPYVYVILLTGKTDRGDVIAGLEAGADDYVAKPFDAQELEVRLRIGKRIIAMQSELELQATRDPLTGVWNRRAIMSDLARAISRADRVGTSLSVIMADIDHFKRVNDEHGHLVGDEVLREWTSRVSGSIRPYDALGRYGGEEFVLIFPDTDEVAAASVAERLRAAIASPPFRAQGHGIPVTASFGVARHHAGQPIEAVLGCADSALYAAKTKGRNMVVIAPSPAIVTASGRSDLSPPSPPGQAASTATIDQRRA